MNHSNRLVVSAHPNNGQTALQKPRGKSKVQIAMAGLLASLGQPVMAEIPDGINSWSQYLPAITAISANGKVVVGCVMDNGDCVAGMWSNAGSNSLGVSYLSARNAIATAVNGDGSAIAGTLYLSVNQAKAFMWSKSNGVTYMEGNAVSSESYAISDTGNIVVGLFYVAGSNQTNAFRWDADQGSNAFINLGLLPGDTDAWANGVNKDGTVVVGESQLRSISSRAFRWTSAGMVDIGNMGGNNTSATAVDDSGNIIVGTGDTSTGMSTAFIWRNETKQMTSLGVLHNGISSSGNAVSSDGKVVVGEAITDVNGQTVHSGFRWTEGSGMQTVEDWLKSNGVKIDPSQSTTYDARSTNSDGSIVVGFLNNYDTYIARGKSGIIRVQQFSVGLQNTAQSAHVSHTSAEMVLQGMNGRPMQRLLPVKRGGLWVNGDIGRVDRQGTYGNAASGNIGGGYRFNQTTQLNLNVGQNYSSLDTDFGGQTRLRDTYVMPELMLNLHGNLYAWFAGYYSSGRLDVNRSYLNGGLQEMARGDTHVTSMGGRARLDWLEAAYIGNVSLTPYTSITYVRTKMDGYTESSGGFPVQWNGRTEKSTTARLGVDLEHAVSDTFKVQGRIEGVHRFEKKTANTTGHIVGLSPFEFDGQSVKQNWLRVGAGVEGKIGTGIASIMLNAKTPGEGPTYWLAANYRWVF